MRDKLIASDPTEGVRLPRQRKREAAMTIPTPKQVNELLEAADERFAAFVAVCAFAGCGLGRRRPSALRTWTSCGVSSTSGARFSAPAGQG